MNKINKSSLRLTSVGFWVGFLVGEGVIIEPVTPLLIPPKFVAGMIISGGVGKASVTAIVGIPVVGSWVVGEIVGSFVVGETVGSRVFGGSVGAFVVGTTGSTGGCVGAGTGA